MANAPFPITPELIAIAVAYKNAAMIANEVLPYVPVGKEEFKYQSYPKAEAFTIPDTKVGRKGKPNEVDFSATEQTASTSDQGLDDPIPSSDILNAPPGVNVVGSAAEGLTKLVGLRREKRVADIAFAAGTYPAANKIALTGTDKWSDFTNSDPLDDILTGLDACPMRPNIGVLGSATWNKLRMHPKICKAVNGNSGDVGIVARRAVADLFELDELLVGEGFLNLAAKGQTVNLSRVWGKHAAFLRTDKTANTRGGITFGFTGRWGGWFAGQQDDPNIGLRGGVRVRVGESVKELVIASDLGYFIENAVA